MKTKLLTPSRLLTLLVLTSTFPQTTFASDYKLSHEVKTSDSRKVCVYVDKNGNTIQKEQSVSQYCASRK